jgi:hypothetical protein
MAVHEMEERFYRFAMSLPAAESIDELGLDTSRGTQRADFLWRDRSVIVEVKTLRGDPQGKIDEFVDELSSRADFPLILGPAPLEKVLVQLHDGKEQLRRIIQIVMRPVESAFRAAKNQITGTKELLGLGDAVGVLVLLNPDIEALDPRNIGHEISRRLEERQKKDWTVDLVWLISEAHLVHGAQPCIFIEGNRIDRFPWATAYADHLNERWIAFNNSPAFMSDAATLADMDFKRMSDRSAGLLSNEQRWRANYRTNPYLSHLGDEAVRAFGRRAAMNLAPYFLIDGPHRRGTMLPEELVELWTHFLEEASTRGLDIREVQL